MLKRIWWHRLSSLCSRLVEEVKDKFDIRKGAGSTSHGPLFQKYPGHHLNFAAGFVGSGVSAASPVSAASAVIVASPAAGVAALPGVGAGTGVAAAPGVGVEAAVAVVPGVEAVVVSAAAVSGASPDGSAVGAFAVRVEVGFAAGEAGCWSSEAHPAPNLGTAREYISFVVAAAVVAAAVVAVKSETAAAAVAGSGRPWRLTVCPEYSEPSVPVWEVAPE